VNVLALVAVIAAAASCSRASTERIPTEELQGMPVQEACAALFRKAVSCKDVHWEAERDELLRRGRTNAQIDRARVEFEKQMRRAPASVCRNALEERVRPTVECYSNDCESFVNCLASQRAQSTAEGHQ
jgi:hypothetical protein